MRLLANENFPKDAVAALRRDGHDVLWVAEEFPSAKDEEVLRVAVQQSRVLLTQDKDFGELAFRRRLPASCGIVLFRIPAIPDLVTRYAQVVFQKDADYRGRYVVVEERRIRERALLAPSEGGDK